MMLGATVVTLGLMYLNAFALEHVLCSQIQT